jgi:hypothetical protein
MCMVWTGSEQVPFQAMLIRSTLFLLFEIPTKISDKVVIIYFKNQYFKLQFHMNTLVYQSDLTQVYGW